MNVLIRASMLFAMLILCAVSAQAGSKSKLYARENTHANIDFTGVFKANEEQNKEAKGALQAVLDKERQGDQRRAPGRVSTGVLVMGVPIGGGGRQAKYDKVLEEQELQTIITTEVRAIEIEQRPTEFLVDYGREDYDKFINGDKVSSETGPGGQIEVIAGWNDGAYAVQRKYRNKTVITERFELLDGGQQLSWTMTVHPKKGDDTVVTRVYDRQAE